MRNGRHGNRVHTRFPPEPNGYLHIGHAKSICLNFGIAAENGGLCNLRFDDTNPSKEDVEYVDSIQDDVRWLGFDWDRSRCYYASDYFLQMYEYAEKHSYGQAYVCDLSAQEIRNTGELSPNRAKQPLSGTVGRRKPGFVSADEGGRVSGWHPDPASEDRYGVTQYYYAGSGPVPDFAGDSPSDR